MNMKQLIRNNVNNKTLKTDNPGEQNFWQIFEFEMISKNKKEIKTVKARPQSFGKKIFIWFICI